MQAQTGLGDEQQHANSDEVKGICANAAALSSLSMNLAESVLWEETEAASQALPWRGGVGEHHAAFFVTHSSVHSGAQADAQDIDDSFVVVRAASSASVAAVDSEEGGKQQAAWSRVHLQLQRTTAGAIKTPPTASALCGMLREGSLLGMDPV